MIKKGIMIGLDNTDIKKTDKKDLSEYSIEEIRGWIIDELNKIEQKIDSIITNFFNPVKSLEFRNIILNSSIVSTGAKMKILRNIDLFDTKIIGKIQTIISIRNAFAHIPITKAATITITNEKGNLIWSLESVVSQLDIMNSNGEIKKKKAMDLIVEYENLVNEVNGYLDSTKN
jgi:hypothetical protein